MNTLTTLAQMRIKADADTFITISISQVTFLHKVSLEALSPPQGQYGGNEDGHLMGLAPLQRYRALSGYPDEQGRSLNLAFELHL